MQNVVKKVYISILTCVIVMITMVATTFAWVGILTTTGVGEFEIGIRPSQNVDNYNLLISADDITYSKLIEQADIDDYSMKIKQQIMKNMGINYENTLTNPNDPQIINTFFNRTVSLEPVSTNLINNTLSDFYSMSYSNDNTINISEQNISKKYYKFDIYLKISPNNTEDLSDIDGNLFICNLAESLTGKSCTGTLANKNHFGNILDEKYKLLNDLPSTVTVDSSSSARFALSIYDPIAVNDKYINETPRRTVIYQGGSNYPTLNNGIYSFGGILPEEYNLALKEINTIYKTNYGNDDFPEGRTNDIEISSGDGSIIDSNSDYCFGIRNGVVNKIKLTIYFWFEGWDADCMYFIDRKAVNLNLRFAIEI